MTQALLTAKMAELTAAATSPAGHERLAERWCGKKETALMIAKRLGRTEIKKALEQHKGASK